MGDIRFQMDSTAAATRPLTLLDDVIRHYIIDQGLDGTEFSGREGFTPASKESIDALPTIKQTDQGSECAICLSDFEVGEEAKQMPCKHIYHAGCIDKWLGIKGSCPSCRFKMPEMAARMPLFTFHIYTNPALTMDVHRVDVGHSMDMDVDQNYYNSGAGKHWRKKSHKAASKKLKSAELDTATPFQFPEDENEAAFSLKDTAPSRSHGVQPLGNFYLSASSRNSRNSGLGNLKSLTDELVLDILALLEGSHLGFLSTVSKSLYVFCSHEPLWRNLVLENCKGGFLFSGTWRSTYINAVKPCLEVLDSGLRVRDFYSDYLFQSWLCANLEMKPEWLQRDNIIRKKGISVEEFVENFEDLNKPVLLEGCLDDWEAFKKWDKDYLTELGDDVSFSVGPVEMRLRDYFQYSELCKEERPLYLFDPKFVDKVPRLRMDYRVPGYFSEDLFSVLGEERPDYRWIIIGPAGSGSSFHIDPNSTSAWNAVIKGSKKWVLFPPDVVPPGVHPSPDGAEVACPVSIIEWFMNFYSDTRNWNKKPIECVCRAGEVIFVPNGWWHLVINLEDSIAITQNFVSRRNLLNVLDFLKKPNACEVVSGTRDRVNLHEKFKKAIEASFPGIIDEALLKAEEKKTLQKKLPFWESVADSNAGAFKFSF